jgi:hypothetical protein
VTIVGEMMVDGRIMVCSGGACGNTLDESVDETMGDMGVEGTIVAGSFAGYCDDGYIWVIGSAKYGTMPGFCVQQDEMTYEYTDENMVNMTQGEANLFCQGIDDGYHLISENEWMTIAENIIRVIDNDIDNNKDGLQLSTASSTAISSSSEFILSNGNKIYNLIGGVAEWTDQTITVEELIKSSSSDWEEYAEITDYKGFNIAPPYYYTDIDNGIGRIKTGIASSSPDYLRGFVRGENALYDLDLSYSPTDATSTIGFRCAK